jgi:hypothetical protein
MAQNHRWLPPSVDASWGHFLSSTMDEEPGALGPTRLKTSSHPRSPVEKVGTFQILVKLNIMNTY